MRQQTLLAAALAASISLAYVNPLAQRPSPVAFRQYSVTLRPLSDETKPPREAAEEAAAAALGPGWEVAAIRDSVSDFTIQPKEASPPGSLAAAWTGVHRLHSTEAFARAEPVFDTQPSPQPGPVNPNGQWHGECEPAWSGTASGANADGALTDSTWSLGPRGANVFEAWKLPARGQGVTIAHPDTGYLNHPSVTPALLGRGFNYTTRRADAIDTADDGVLQWPGHGTRTSSVIAGRLFELSRHWISGVAPAARVMPLKVAHRVLLLDWFEYDMSQLAKAIRAAAIGDPNFVRARADIISMSLGGLQNKDVEEALAVAEANNVIVLAAAGNQVPGRQVVYPARYPNVIAVAATNFSGANWEYSSKGRAIAFAAPGQNVWTAKYRWIDERAHHCIEPSSGTSYAVATSAGVAALWLSFHRKTLNERADIDLPKTFKALAACTARHINVDDPEAYGGGIIDAAALLAEPLPERDGPAAKQSERCARALRSVPPRPLGH